MTTKAQEILDQIKALPPEDRQEVLDAAVQLRQRELEWEQQKAKLRELQARHSGEGLLELLLEERAKERARG